jgi:hypothetical protein
MPVRGFHFVCATAVLLLAAAAGRASVEFQYVTDATSYSASGAGASVTATLYLRETDKNSSASLIAAESGLGGAGVVVAQASGSPSGATLTTISAVADNKQTHPDGFDGGNNIVLVYNSNKNARILENIALSANSGPSGTTNGGSVTTSGTTRVTLVLLGTVTLKAGDVGSTTTFSMLPYKSFSQADGNTVSALSNFDLDVTNNANQGGGATYTGADNFITNPYQFTVTVAAVPEPGSMALGAVAASALALGAWRRWRRGRTTKDSESAPAP